MVALAMIPVPHLETERLHLIPLSIDNTPSCQKNFVEFDVTCHFSALVPWPNRFIEYVQWEVTNYRSVVMSKTLQSRRPEI